MARPALELGEHGTITERLNPAANATPSAKWKASCRHRSALSGLVQQRSATGPTKSAARKALQAKLAAESSAADTARNMSVQEAARQWHAHQVRLNEWQPTTEAAYLRHNKVDMAPLAGVSLAEATPRVLRHFIRTASDTNGAVSARRLRTILRQTFSHAVDEGLLMANPAVGIKLPRVERTNPRALTWPEVEVAVAIADSAGGYIADGIPALVGSGLRIGELLGLRRQDFLDGERPRVRVAGSVIQPEGRPAYRRANRAKTVASLRSVPVLPVAAEALRRRVALLDAAGRTAAEELLFQTSNGTAVSPNNFRRDWRAVRSLTSATQGLRVHELRATYATLAMSLGGASAEVTAQLLGHGGGTQTLFAHYFSRPDEVDHDWAYTPPSAPTVEA